MKTGDAVRYKGKRVVFEDRRLEPGIAGVIVSIVKYQETWFAVLWDGAARPTFHLERELAPGSD